MDQDKDTINRAKHPRGRRHWLADDAPAAPQSAEAEPEAMPEIPPTLFELPDRTPEALQKPKESPHFMVDEAHSGPPACHVNRPPGDFSEIEPPPAPEPSPFGPATPLVERPPSDVGSDHSYPVRIDSHPDAIPDPEHRIAAFHDQSSTEDFRAKPAWGVRSAITLLVLAMVTLAYFSGRRSRPGKTEDDPERVAATSGDEVLIDVAADFESEPETSFDAKSDDPNADPLASEVLVTEDILTEVASLPDSEDEAAKVEASEAETSAAVPSYVAEASIDSRNPDFAADIDSSFSQASSERSPDTALGEPSLSDESASFVSGLYEMESVGFPNPLENGDATVAYRTNAGAEDLPEPADDLPAGMDDRLRLEDGLRYTGTPYPIGNFLEILRNWEASDQQ